MNFINEVIYSLKQEYGFPLTLVHIISTTNDIDTGAIIESVSTKYINLALVLSNKLARKFFKQGTAYDLNSRAVILDAQDIINFEIGVDDFIIYNNRQYIITNITTFDDQAAKILEIKESKDSTVIYPIIETELTVTDSIDADT